MIDLLTDLLLLRAPPGEEDEVRNYCKELLTPHMDELYIDPSGNLIAMIQGDRDEDPIRFFAHMDELALNVKRIEENGNLKVQPVGGIFPSDMGQGPVDILGDINQVPGVLSAGSAHTTKETPHRWKTSSDGEDKARLWSDTYIFTGKNKSSLIEDGIHPGTRIVIAKERRNPFFVPPYIGAYFHDNRAAVAVLITLFLKLSKIKNRNFPNLYAVFSTEEEIGAQGASYASRTLPGSTSIAIDVGPVEEEYQTVLNEHPIIAYQDSKGVYSKQISNQLLHAGKKIGLTPQCAVWGRYASDASISKAYGQCAQAALLCIPTLNTHGYEVIHPDALTNCVLLLEYWLS